MSFRIYIRCLCNQKVVLSLSYEIENLCNLINPLNLILTPDLSFPLSFDSGWNLGELKLLHTTNLKIFLFHQSKASNWPIWLLINLQITVWTLEPCPGNKISSEWKSRHGCIYNIYQSCHHKKSLLVHYLNKDYIKMYLINPHKIPYLSCLVKFPWSRSYMYSWKKKINKKKLPNCQKSSVISSQKLCMNFDLAKTNKVL